MFLGPAQARKLEIVAQNIPIRNWQRLLYRAEHRVYSRKANGSTDSLNRG